MAVLIMCAVYDIKAESYGRPICVTAKGLAIRAFLDELKNPESSLSRYPDDFRLFELGEYDESTGSFDSLVQPALLMDGATAKSL